SERGSRDNGQTHRREEKSFGDLIPHPFLYPLDIKLDMDLFFYLLGEHETLPKGEVLATLESLKVNYSVIEAMDQALVISTDLEETKTLEKRLAFTHALFEHLGSCNPSFDEIIAHIQGLDIKIEGSYAVRVKRVMGHGRGLDITKLERAIGDKIWEKGHKTVDLDSPKNLFYGLLTNSRFVFGRRLATIDKSQFEDRKPHLRPYFHPSSMKPKLARAIINLSRIKSGEKLMDPFCGTGGLLIEGGLIGANVFGADISREMVKGCEENLRHLGIGEFELLEKDVSDLKTLYRDYFDAVATDPPYGKSSTTMGQNLTELYEDALESLHVILKPKRYAVIVSPETTDLERLATDQGFKMEERYLVRIHKSLTRKIMVLRK
ncbi:MAG: TIGR01177 family methyltransferase, partial [Candidatus Hydrothermarchaeales archaeon]